MSVVRTYEILAQMAASFAETSRNMAMVANMAMFGTIGSPWRKRSGRRK